MARLTWGASGARFYEGGIDQGVFFLGNNAGVPWNGLRSVSEGAASSAPRPFYLDGVKYLNLSTGADFEAVVSAYSAPEGFDACVGRVAIAPGLLATEQRRLPFAFSYRTKLGNDESGLDYGYQIHIVYNALATPAQIQRNTISSAPAPADLSWNVSTIPAIVAGIRPTAHFIIDSLSANPEALSTLEAILYGDASQNARLPGAAELISILGA